MKFSSFVSAMVLSASGQFLATIARAQVDTDALKDKSELPSGVFSTIVDNLLTWGLFLFGFIAIIGFVISGILYLTATGSPRQLEKAKESMKWSLIGIIVALSGSVIIQAVNLWLGGSNAQF